jgi:hypothetical protein
MQFEKGFTLYKVNIQPFPICLVLSLQDRVTQNWVDKNSIWNSIP